MLLNVILSPILQFASRRRCLQSPDERAGNARAAGGRRPPTLRRRCDAAREGRTTTTSDRLLLPRPTSPSDDLRPPTVARTAPPSSRRRATVTTSDRLLLPRSAPPSSRRAATATASDHGSFFSPRHGSPSAMSNGRLAEGGRTPWAVVLQVVGRWCYRPSVLVLPSVSRSAVVGTSLLPWKADRAVIGLRLCYRR